MIVAGGIASAEATRGQCKQTKSAVAPLTPSQCTLLFIDLYCCLGTNGTPTKFVSIKLNKLRWGREAVQRATAKPSGRLRRGEISASTRESSMKEKSTQSRERVKGGDFVPFHSPLRSPEAASLAPPPAQKEGCTHSYIPAKSEIVLRDVVAPLELGVRLDVGDNLVHRGERQTDVGVRRTVVDGDATGIAVL